GVAAPPHSFPTRRSSDLLRPAEADVAGDREDAVRCEPVQEIRHRLDGIDVALRHRPEARGAESDTGVDAAQLDDVVGVAIPGDEDRKSTRLNSSHQIISY